MNKNPESKIVPTSPIAKYILEQSVKAAELAYQNESECQKLRGLAMAFIAVEAEMRKLHIAEAVCSEDDLRNGGPLKQV